MSRLPVLELNISTAKSSIRLSVSLALAKAHGAGLTLEQLEVLEMKRIYIP